MNWRAIGTLIRKDLTVVRRSPTILLPMIILPLILQVVMPLLIGLGVRLAPESFTSDADLAAFLNSVPASVQQQFEGLNEGAAILIVMLVYLFAPLYLIVPLMVSSVIAADSFVGERERKTMEALLHSPVTDLELALAKTLAPWLAALVVAWVSFGLYGLVVNALGFELVGRIFFPNSLWVILAFWVAPAVAGLGLATTVAISSRVNTFQEAYQLGGIVILPIIALMVGQLAGVLFLSPAVALGIGAGVWFSSVILLWWSARSLRREVLLKVV